MSKQTKLTPKKTLLIHLQDLITKTELDWKNGYGVYDDFDGSGVIGLCDIRNTDDLLVSLKTAYTILDNLKE